MSCISAAGSLAGGGGDVAFGGAEGTPVWADDSPAGGGAEASVLAAVRR
jgi:hypothetical protein